MKIIINENTKESILVNKEGKEVSRYSYKNIINENFTFDDFKKETDRFNETLEKQEEFDDIKELSKVIKIHNF